MNEVILKGVLANPEYSHTINTTDYYKANLLVKKQNGEEDIIPLRFKQFSNKYQDGQEIELKGNLRSHSRIEDNKNKVDIYVFTYFDIPENTDEEIINHVALSGRVCKVDGMHTTKNGKNTFHFTLANNIISQNNKQKLNNYIPITVWGQLAKNCSELQVNDQIELTGQFHSRTYLKRLNNENSEFRVAYEVVADKVLKVE